MEEKTCPHCQKVYSWKKGLDRHLQECVGNLAFPDSHSGYQCALDRIGKLPVKVPPKKKFKCPQCPRRYQWKSTMLRHIRTECGFSPQFQCPYCPQRTIRKDNLVMHINRKHGPGMLNFT
ncbi:zinc finger protein 75A-like [Frankliniella occidentalis]|uniref:Zinc finger protein 75A-like n=1 Tax=Frankliniella occidentalis TaxID=133901 RepID=A0A6J1TDV4_FRAOC|nr:zinc finger protein 75A-like [Frankliniella occidentalis]